jgi:transposase InsO family protein
VDAHSKWSEVIILQKITSTKTRNTLRNMFTRNRLPEHILSDNGPQFLLEEFQKFVSLNGRHPILSELYHPATNGLAKRFLQTFKQGVKARDKENADIH